MGDGMMPPGMGAKPPMGGGGNAVQKNMSIFNPTDGLLMGKSGQMGPDKTIREGFSAMGLDVDKNTMADLSKFVGEQAQKANPMNKMRNMGGAGSPPGAGAAPPMPPAPPQNNPGGQEKTLDSLMKGM